MSSLWSSSKVKPLEFTQSRSSSVASSNVSPDSSFSGSQISLPNSIFSVDVDDNEPWRNALLAKLFIEPLENRFLCASCLRVLHFPVSLSKCDHNVCSSCLGDICRKQRVCPVDGKPFVREEAIADNQLQSELNNLELECPHKHSGCIWKGKLENFKVHFETCDHSETVCPNGCNHRCPKRLMENHVTSDCPLRLVTCEFCKRNLSAEHEIEHLKDCPRLPVSCPKSCGKLQIPRDEVKNHLHNECTLAEFSCPYEQLQCSFKGGRAALSEHIEKCLKEHVALLCEGVLQHSKLLSVQGGNLTECIDTVKQQTNKLSFLAQESKTQLLWKITDWSTKMSNAVANKHSLIQSVPFYTGRHQYKLSLCLLPNGDRAAKGKFMSLYVRVCKGEYDALQSWPFALNLDLILVDQSQDPRGRSDFVYALRPNPCKENLPFLGRPTADANPSFGPQKFVSHALLRSRDYVRDDVIFIRTCVVREKK